MTLFLFRTGGGGAPGDHIGWHYDKSYYRGLRFTLLRGVIDDRHAGWTYECITRDPGLRLSRVPCGIPPGGAVSSTETKCVTAIAIAQGETRSREISSTDRFRACGRGGA